MDSERIDRALADALSGRAVLFVGAGAGREAINRLGEMVPAGDKLSQLMCDDLGKTSKNYRLTTISQHYKKKKGPYELLEFLRRHLFVSTVSSEMQRLIGLPWIRMYTTNYDNLLETCCPSVNVYVASADVERVVNGAIVHLNGFISRVTAADLDSDLVLTDWSYAKSQLFESSWSDILYADIQAASSVLFIGYSISDLDVSRVIARDPSVTGKVVIVVKEDEDDLEVERLSEYGAVYSTGMKYVFSRLRQIQKTFVVQSGRPLLVSSMQVDARERASADLTQVTWASALFAQFVYGRIDERWIGKGASSDESVIVDRPDITEAIEQIERNDLSVLLLTGNIGSGKTFSAIVASHLFESKRYRVFRVVNNRRIIGEMQEIIRWADGARVVFVFENFYRYTDEIRHFAKIRRPGDCLVLTARSAIGDLYDEYIKEVFPVGVLQVDLDRLSPAELVSLDRLLGYAGVWGAMAGWSSSARARYLRDSLDSSFPKILLKIARSQDIKDRVASELAMLLADSVAERVFVAALILNALQYEFWLADWQSIFSIDDVNRVLSKHRQSISNFMNIGRSSWHTSSSLMTTDILRTVISNKTIVDVLVIIYRKASLASSSDDYLEQLRFDLMRYNQIESLFNETSESDKYRAIRAYYQTIRTVNGTSEKSDYWLQYGIALSIHGDLKIAEELREAEDAFATAYSKEKAKQRPNTIRIDNYYARFLIQRAAVIEDSESAGRVFNEASQKLIRQIFTEEARHYPFKVGRIFTDIAAAHYFNWSPSMQKVFLGRCREMLKFATERRKSQQSKDIDFMVNEVTALLRRLEGEA